jgi:hypothetical protein
MTTAELQERTEAERIEDWRRERLESVGFSPEAASALAQSPHVDLHDAIALLQRGCPVDVAVRILL